MNCGDCEDRLEAYADRELSEKELAEVKRHLEACPPCEHRYEFHAELKRVVKVCCEQDKAPPELRDKLRQILF